MLTDFNFQVMHKEWPTGLRDTRSTDAAVIFVVRKTFLEHHSRTALHHLPKQLKRRVTSQMI